MHVKGIYRWIYSMAGVPRNATGSFNAPLVLHNQQ